jgi:5-deoxy-glucuronate isomerase
MSDNARWVRPFGSAGRDGWDVVIDAGADGWEHTSLYAGRLAEGESREVPAGEWEHVVVPLSGSVTVECEAGKAALAGRPSVFAGPTDVAYVARDTA